MLQEENQSTERRRLTIRKKEVVDHKKIFWILMFGAFPIIIIQTAIRTALPIMLDDLQIAPAVGQWIVTGYALIKGMMVPISAFAMNKFHTRRLFLFILGLFGFGSLIAAAGGSFTFVLLGSVLQGISAGLIFPLIQTFLFLSFPISERGSAMGTMGIAMGVGPVFGPALGGWFVDVLTWHHLFYFVGLMALVAMAVSYVTIGDLLPRSNPTMDWLAIVYSVFGFGGVLYGLGVIGVDGFTSGTAWAAIGAGALFVWLFVMRTKRSQTPLLNLNLLKKRSFLLAVLISMLGLMTVVGITNIMPIYVQSILGQAAVVSGFVVMPGGIIKAVLSPVSGRLYDRVGIKKLGSLGGGLMLLGAILFLFLTPDTPVIVPALIYVVVSAGFGFLNTPITTAGLNALTQDELSHGTAVRQTVRGIGSSFATALAFSSMSLFSLFASNGADSASGMNITGVRGSFIVVVLCAFLAFVLTFFFKDE